MSNRTYHLRMRTRMGITAPSQVQNPLDTDPVMALYSEVAGLRPPSPTKETSSSESPVELVGRLFQEVDSEGVHGYSRTEMFAASNNHFEKTPNYTSSDDFEPSPRVEEQPWTTVKRRRARSLDSVPGIKSMGEKKVTSTKVLIGEQTQTVQAALLAMEPGESDLIQRRQQKIAPRCEDSSPSQGEGPSRPKGKAIDPREWGNANLSQEDLDLEAQAAVLNSFARPSNKEGLSKRKATKTKNQQQSTRSHPQGPPTKPAELRPATQIAQNSYLGMALSPRN